jgi:hypothetical protein
VSDDDDQDATNDPGLRSMRAVWLSMRDEEPPAAGLSALLAAARDQADAMRPKDPWWQRALLVLRRPPMLALASVVVLLGGAVALTMRGDDMKVESPPAETQRAPAADRAKLEAPAPAPVQPPQIAQEPERGKAELETKKDLHAPKPPVVHRAAPPRTVAKTTAAPGRGFGGEDAKAPEPPPERPKKESDSRGEGGLAIATDGRTPEVAGESAPRAADETIETTGSAPRAQTSTAQLVQQCETAAARGDCAATRVTAAKIKKLDAAVYKARIQSNQAIARCLK